MCLLFLGSCASPGGRAERAHVPPGTKAEFVPLQAKKEASEGTSPALDDCEVIADQTNQLSKVEVTVVARVKKLLPDDTRGLEHQKFLLILSNGTTILVAHDLHYAPRVPIQPGDLLKIHGEYIFNRLGGLIHWTHHSDTFRHESGWIEFNGKIYE
jgi:hypothetical protein